MYCPINHLQQILKIKFKALKKSLKITTYYVKYLLDICILPNLVYIPNTYI